MIVNEIKLNINSKTFIKDPSTTNLGRKIIENSVILIDEMGLEDFSFRKLAIHIKSTESSIYRYFENKHCLFIYLLNWYWEWTSIRIDFGLVKIDDPEEKLKFIIKTIIESSTKNADLPFVDEEILHRIVVREGPKAYHHKLVDTENEYGFFLSYKALCKKIANVILEINENHSYPKALASTLIETANNNLYFAKHLPRLTDISHVRSSASINKSLFKILEHLAFSSIQYENGDSDKKKVRAII
jgi:AcrR family transcriptional regulator